MQALINGVMVTGTPQEIVEYQRVIAGNEQKKVPLPEQFPPPWLLKPLVTSGTTAMPKGSYIWNGLPDNSWG